MSTSKQAHLWPASLGYLAKSKLNATTEARTFYAQLRSSLNAILSGTLSRRVARCHGENL
eukprot:810126-Pleurochrysis_carterae.AAC.1